MRYPDDVIQFLQQVRIPLRLAVVTSNGWPLVLSLWFVHRDDAVYCATQSSARVLTHLKRNPRCAFEIAGDEPPYCGVRSRALAEIEPDKGDQILKRLLDRYLDGVESPLAQNLLSRADEEVAIRLNPQSIYTWNFTQRMRSSLPVADEKPCPSD